MAPTANGWQLLIARHNGIAVLLDTMRSNVTDASVQATHRLNRARTAAASRPGASAALRRTSACSAGWFGDVTQRSVGSQSLEAR